MTFHLHEDLTDRKTFITTLKFPNLENLWDNWAFPARVLGRFPIHTRDRTLDRTLLKIYKYGTYYDPLIMNSEAPYDQLPPLNLASIFLDVSQQKEKRWLNRLYAKFRLAGRYMSQQKDEQEIYLDKMQKISILSMS